jgi:molybdopterin synthase catalytic subunit
MSPVTAAVPAAQDVRAGMTEREISKIVEESQRRWKVLDATVIHRYGELEPTEQIVLVAVASPHRADAFAACEFIMDYLKTRAPFWKKEHGKDSSEGGWVDARNEDEDRMRSWSATSD